MKINDRIYWISGGPWGYLGNAYAIKHSNGYVLVDTGSPEALDVIVKNLKYWNIDENKITHVLITHAHDDHTGCAHCNIYYFEIEYSLYTFLEIPHIPLQHPRTYSETYSVSR